MKGTGGLCLATAVAIAATGAFAIGSGSGRDTIHKPDYVGETIGGSRTPVLIRIKTKHSKRRYARVEAKDYAINCDDGAFDEVSFGPVRARFLTRRLFQYQSYITDEIGRFFFQVRGRLFPGRGVAEVQLIYIRNPVLLVFPWFGERLIVPEAPAGQG